MAYSLTLTDYVKRENAVLTKELFKGGDTGKFALTMAGVKGSTKVPHLSGAATLQEGACATPSGTRTAVEVTLTVVPFTVYELFCQDDLETKFPNMSVGSNNNGADLKPWEETLVDTIVSSVNETLELTYWQGTDGTGSYQLFDGYIDLIDTAADAIDANAGGITVATGIVLANVVTVVEGMFSNHTNAKVKRSKEFVILVGDDVFDLYIQKLKADNLYHYAPQHDDGSFKVGGSNATLQRVYGLNGTDRLFSGIGSNFIIGADVADEKDVMDIFYDQTTDKTYARIKAKAGVQVANTDELAEFTLVP